MADKTLPPIAIGDSLAVGMREANNLPGIGRVGAGPKEVYEMLQRFATSESLSGRDVFIGTGMPNIPEQKKFIEQQIDFVRKQGGNPILIGVGPGTKSKPTTGQNEFLASLAESKGLPYMGPLVNMFPDVTKDPMGLHLRAPQYKQIFKQYSKSQAQPQPQPQVQPQSREPSAADLLSQFTGAVLHAESKGRRYDKSGKLLTSPKGAQGEMQVMPGTITDPGFGVKPAKDSSPEEIARVGRDYAAVMLRRYNNNPTLAAVAYNWGPGNADRWIKGGADVNKLPKETRDYVVRIAERMGAPVSIPAVAQPSPAPNKRADVRPVPPAKRVSTTTAPRAEAPVDYVPLGATLDTAPRPAEQQNVVTRADMERLGPSYQAALAATTLADSRDDDDDYFDDDETIAERYMERRGEQIAREESTLEEEPAQTSALEGLSEISYQSPFGPEPEARQPVRLAQGGMVYRADGSPVYGEIADTGPITSDTRKAFANRQSFDPREALAALKRIAGEGVSNLESMARGSVAGVPGVVGDIESIFRDDKKRKFATSTEVERQYLPKRFTEPTKESQGFVEIGTAIDPSIALKAAPKTAKAALKTLKESGPQVEEVLMKAAPAAQPLGIVSESRKMLMEVPESSLFVSKVDDFIASQKGPVTKQQLLGQMKGKFRDYEIGRVSAALANYPDTAKFTPDYLLSAVQSSYPTSKLKTYVLEPQKIDRWSSTDNVYFDQPVGVVNLRFDTPMEKVYKSLSNQEALDRLAWITSPTRFATSDKKAQDIADLAGAIRGLPDANKFNGLLGDMDRLYASKNKTDTMLAEIDNAYSAYKYPATKDGWSTAINEYYAKNKGPSMFEDAKKYANEVVQKEADRVLKNYEIKIPSKSLSPEEFIKELQANAALKMQSISQKEKDAVAELTEKFYPELTEAAKAFRSNSLYEGQHKSLTPKGTPIAFSRFVDHTVNLPDKGETKVMHMVELQSDLLDDIRKTGSKSGSKVQDLEDLLKTEASIKKILKEDPRLVDPAKKLDHIRSTYPNSAPVEKSEAYRSIIKENPEIEKELIEYMKLRDKESRLNVRSRQGKYDLEEAFPGMEMSPQVVQQMMIKNAIGGAMQRGVTAVTFPGKESKQAQLYEKLYPNLKQVVKDLGPGFDLRQIELYDSLGNAYSHWGVVWDDGTAKKVMKQGIRFNKGGLVDKQDSDYRKFI